VRLVLAVMITLGPCACASAATSAPAKGSAHAASKAAENDGARCEYKGVIDREAVESVGTAAVQPSIRRVFRVVGEGEQRRRILACREADTNLDGTKDLVRFYNDKGEPMEEQADSDYDGRFETTIRFTKGRISQVAIDEDGDGKPEEMRFYLQGRLSRVQRDTNHDGKPDVWEVYQSGRLERMGVDLDYDGRVDRWNRDQIARREAERKEREEEERAAKAAGGAPPASGDEASGEAEEGAAPAPDGAALDK
jgi:hypothetical protein